MTLPSEVTSVLAPDSCDIRRAYRSSMAVATLSVPITTSCNASGALMRRKTPDGSVTTLSRSLAPGGAMKEGQPA